MELLKIIAFTHKQIDLKSLGKLVICESSLDKRLRKVQQDLAINEIFYVATCNRVEFIFTAVDNLDRPFISKFLQSLEMGLPVEYMDEFIDKVSTFESQAAFNHLLRTSCSLESLVVGEKEILAQVRKAYDLSKKAGLTGDYLRMIMNRVVKTAKEVYTRTNISRNPISVVSLAYRKLRDLNVCSNSRLVIIGAGETNKNLAQYLKKHKYANFYIFNRTFEKAKELAEELNGKAFPLSELENFKEGFDVLITCTGAAGAIVDSKMYSKLLNGDTSKKVIVDLAVPNDIAAQVLENYPIHYIEVESLKELAKKNIEERYKELHSAEQIIEENIKEFQSVLRQRRIELAMGEVPEKIKKIKHKALNTVFAEEIQSLDEESKAVLQRVLDYMEKKYISVPMIMAKEILVKNS